MLLIKLLTEFKSILTETHSLVYIKSSNINLNEYEQLKKERWNELIRVVSAFIIRNKNDICSFKNISIFSCYCTPFHNTWNSGLSNWIIDIMLRNIIFNQ